MIRSFSATCLLVGLTSVGQVSAQVQAYDSVSQDNPHGSESNKNSRVSLRQVLEFAMDHSPELGVAAARVARARAEIAAEQPLLPSDPVVSGGVGLRRNQSRSGVDYQVGLSQEFDLAGKRSTRLRVARAGLLAEQREVTVVEWRIHQRVHALYHRAIVARERVRAAERFVTFGNRVRDVAAQRLQAGETSQIPVRLAETEVAQAKQALLDARSRYRATQLELAQVSGWSVHALPEPIEGLDAPHKTPPVAQLVALARKADPALKAARARSQAARLRVVAAERSAWPNPVVGVQYERESDPTGSPSHVVSGTLSLPIPLWRGSGPERARSGGELEQARAETKRAELLVETEVGRAAQAVDASADRVLVFGKEIVPTSQENLGLIERAFELGEIDMTQVLVARERFLRTQDAALAAYEDYYNALANLEAVLGTEVHQDTSHQHADAPRRRP